MLIVYLILFDQFLGTWDFIFKFLLFAFKNFVESKLIGKCKKLKIIPQIY